MVFPRYSEINSLDDKNTIKQMNYINEWIEQYAKEKNFEIISSHGGTFNIPNMFSNAISYKDLYDFHYANYRCSKWLTIEWFMYKKCIKKYSRYFVYLTENKGKFITTQMTEEEINNQKEEIVNVAICNYNNTSFNLDLINKGLFFAIRRDLKNLIWKIF